MCFSAPASFIASGGLIALGGASLVAAKKEDKILAAIPFLFGIQQGLEGIQWLHLNTGSTSLIAGYGFLFFAFMFWPIYVPAFVYMLDTHRRYIMRWFLVLGIIVAAYFLAILLTQQLHISEYKACVNYSFNFPLSKAINTGYLIAVFGPLFISSYRVFKWFGAVVAVCALISWLFFTADSASVWCFFAAIVSSMFFVYLQYKQHRWQKFFTKIGIK